MNEETTTTNTTPARRVLMHESEWELRTRLIRFMNAVLDVWEEDPKKYGTEEALTKIIECTTKLGRLALEDDATANASAAVCDDLVVALLTIQGPPKTEAVAPSAQTTATPSTGKEVA